MHGLIDEGALSIVIGSESQLRARLLVIIRFGDIIKHSALAEMSVVEIDIAESRFQSRISSVCRVFVTRYGPTLHSWHAVGKRMAEAANGETQKDREAKDGFLM